MEVKIMECIFNDRDIEKGKELFRNVRPGITAVSVDECISYFVHHKRLNKEETRYVLIYLLSEKYCMSRELYEVDQNLFYKVFGIIIGEYIRSRDYKLLQYIYSNDTWIDYLTAAYRYFRECKPHEMWRLSLYNWDINFTKFIYSDFMFKLPPELKKELINSAATFSPDRKLIRQLRLKSIGSKDVKYCDYKLDMLQKMFKSKAEKTHK